MNKRQRKTKRKFGNSDFVQTDLERMFQSGCAYVRAYDNNRERASQRNYVLP